MGGQDIFVNVTGGLKVDEPGADLGIVSAMVSSFMDRPVYRDMVILGEVGLAGEIRGVSRPGLRIKEAKKMGFSKCLLSSGHKGSVNAPAGMELVFLDSIRELVEALF
jgi:DNA repair protein RadA/Sms